MRLIVDTLGSVVAGVGVLQEISNVQSCSRAMAMVSRISTLTASASKRMAAVAGLSFQVDGAVLSSRRSRLSAHGLMETRRLGPA